MPTTAASGARRYHSLPALLPGVAVMVCLLGAIAPAAAEATNVPVRAPDRAFLGIGIVGGPGAGVHVGRVLPDSAAEQSGILAGDVIVGVGRSDIADRAELFGRLAELDPGDPVEVTVLRDGERRRLDVELGRRPGKVRIELDGSYTLVSPRKRGNYKGTLLLDESEVDQYYVCDAENCKFSGTDPVWYRVDCIGRGCPGFQVQFFNRPMLGVRLVAPSRSLDTHPAFDRPGAVIGEVYDGSPAAEAGFKVGDLIVELDDQPVADAAGLRALLDASLGGMLEAGVVRDDEELRLRIRLPDQERVRR